VLIEIPNTLINLCVSKLPTRANTTVYILLL